jgi:hypothetical protein
MTQHLALITTENLPRSSHPCAGGGIRIWGLGEALRRLGVQCTYFLHEPLAKKIQPAEDLPIRFFRPERLHQEIQEAGCDAVLFEQWQPLTFLQQPLDLPTIVDLPGPLILEYYWRERDRLYQHIVDKLDCLAQADYFICAHPRQLGYYSAWLTWAGVSPAENDRLAVVPFTFHEMPYSRQGYVEDEPIFFWGGMFWQWQDRFRAFQLIADRLAASRQGQLVVIGEIDATGSDRRYADFLNHSHVSWLGRLGFTEFVYELKRATVQMDLSKPTLERTLSSDLRTGTALWAGTPCMVTPESAWADLITQHNAGWVIDYSNEKLIAGQVTEIALNRGDIIAKRRGARAVSQLICQDAQVQPLLDWLQHPSRREKHPPFHSAREQDREHRLRTLQHELDALRHENTLLQHDLNNIRSNPLFRLYKRVMGGRK